LTWGRSPWPKKVTEARKGVCSGWVEKSADECKKKQKASLTLRTKKFEQGRKSGTLVNPTGF